MARRFGALALPVGAVVLALLLLPAASAGSGATFRASVATGGGQANSRSFVPAISADGRFVAFYSDASNLVAEDKNGSRDVFVNDRQTGETTRMSIDSSGTEANDDSFAPAISADGRFVTFSSAASNLVADDTNGADDVFFRDRQANTTTRVSLAPGAVQANNGSYPRGTSVNLVVGRR
jgi:Tol biopolymer transport system component